jgi:TPR repeat protein
MRSNPWFILSVLAALCAAAGAAPAQQPPGREPERTRGELERAAAKGEAEAQYRLGVLGRSEGSAERRQAALSWLRRAARQGHKLAQYELGCAYTRGEGRNLPLAVQWLERAAEQRHAQSWLALGDLYAEGGPGLLQDAAAARECYRKAETKGNGEVYRSLGGVYRWGRGGVTADWARAQDFYLKAAKLGDRESQYVTGQFYQYGIGTAANLERAVRWYTEAARQGDHSAEENSAGSTSTGPASIRTPRRPCPGTRRPSSTAGIAIGTSGGWATRKR